MAADKIISDQDAGTYKWWEVAGDAGTDGVYTAGKYIIKFYGVKSDFS